MKRIIPISRLDRVIAVLDGSAQLESPFDVRNLRLQGYDCYMRYGYTNKAAKQAGFVDEGAYGLGWFEGVSQVTGETIPQPKECFITIENTGSIRPYLRNAGTLSPTQIGTTVLTSGYWNFASYNNYVYAICPNADKLPTPKPTVYKHLLGETTGSSAWEEIQNSSYVDPGSDAELTVSANPLTSRYFGASDSWTYVSQDGITGVATFANPVTINDPVTVTAQDNDNGDNHRTTFTVTFSGAEDWTRYGDYGAITINAGIVFPSFEKTNIAPILRTNGIDRTLEFVEFLSASANSVTIVFRLKGVASLNLAEKFTFTVGGYVGRVGTKVACYIESMLLGGTYIEQTGTTQRIWDTPLVGNGVYYGVRYKNGGTYSNLIQGSITATQSQGFKPKSYCPPLGGIIKLSVPQRTVGGWTDVEFVRQLDNASGWKVISTQANTGGTIQYQDRYQENELSPLTTATGIGTVLPPAPPFRTAGIVGAFPYKQSMIWLINQTFQNLQFSRVGNPLELFDSAASLTYDPDDVTVPAQYTLADDQADIPMWGTQAGQIAFIIGKSAAYAMVGDYPSTMSPSRQIPGSRGIAGYYAGTRFRSSQGVWGAAYADTDLNVWVVNSVPQFVGDASVQPQELSMPVRGKLRQFLFEEQKLQLPNITIQDVKLAFQESTSSLWVVLGKRAAVYRQDMVGTGWELYDYTMSSDIAVATCTPYFTNGAIAHDHNGGDSTWSNFGFPFASDDSYCLNAFGLPSSPSSTIARMTKQLRCHSYLPSPLIPTNATITNVRWKVEDSKVGDLQVTQTHAHPTVNGSSYGSNLSTNRIVTTSDVEQVYNLASPLPSLSNINLAHLGIDLQYTQEVWNSNWNNPANYIIAFPDGTTDPEITIEVNYTHGGTPPPYAYINLTSTAEAYLGTTGSPASSAPWSGTATADNGLDSTVTGNVYVDLLNPDVTVIDSSTKRIKITLTSGSGTYLLTRNAFGTVTPPYTNIGILGTYSASATFSPVVPSTVRVDNVAVQVCYTVISTGTNIQWSRLAFSPNDKYVAFRSSGELDVIERDAFTSGFPFIGGTNRDSGLTPPSWYFTTQQIQWDGAKARLASVQYHGQNYNDLIQMSASVDNGSFVNGTLAGLNTSRWYGWHPNVSSGMRHSIKFEGSETDASLKGMAFEFNVQSKGKPK